MRWRNLDWWKRMRVIEQNGKEWQRQWPHEIRPTPSTGTTPDPICDDDCLSKTEPYSRVLSRAGLFGSGSGLKLTKISGLIGAWDVLFVSKAQKSNQNNLATLLDFWDLTWFRVFWAWFGVYISFRVRAYVFGFGPELVRPFTALPYRKSLKSISLNFEIVFN